MFGTRLRSYAAGMQGNPSATNHLTLVRPSIPGRSVAGVCGGFTRKCPLAIARRCSASAAYSPYWIVVSPLSTSCGGETSQP
jgi:hypothetical protein